jgi:hypothetical protein
LPLSLSLCLFQEKERCASDLHNAARWTVETINQPSGTHIELDGTIQGSVACCLLSTIRGINTVEILFTSSVIPSS